MPESDHMATMVFPSRKVIVTFRSSVPLTTSTSQVAVVPLNVSAGRICIARVSIPAAAVEQRVAVVPGTAFLTDDKGTSESVRLNFSTPTDEQIVEGINRLGALTQKMF